LFAQLADVPHNKRFSSKNGFCLGFLLHPRSATKNPHLEEFGEIEDFEEIKIVFCAICAIIAQPPRNLRNYYASS